MTPAARIAATIEAISEVLASWQSPRRIPADKLLDNYFRSRRFIGSKDRGDISERIYWILRHLSALEWWCQHLNQPANPRLLTVVSLIFRKEATPQQLATLFDGSKYSPRPLTDGEWQLAHRLARHGALVHEIMPEHTVLNCPQWMLPLIKETFDDKYEKEVIALNDQAPADLRANTLCGTREELQSLFAKEGIETEHTPLSPHGLRLKKRAPVFASPLFKEGRFEMQDEGSQLLALLVDAQPGQKVIDFCAGAGGKTLALAAQMENKGRIMAWDVSEKRLKQLTPRTRRAKVFNTESRVITSESDPYIKRHKYSADRVLVDAPCSGTGTWRRNPDLKWRFNATDLEEIIALQMRILESASRLVKPGGRLIYATCSLLARENEQQVEKFLAQKTNFTVVSANEIWNKLNWKIKQKDSAFLSLTPHQDGVDGFFGAVLERTDL